MLSPHEDPSRWPAASVAMQRTDALVPYARNARTHSEAQIDQIAASMREWGFTNPVLIDDEGTIIAGHGRVLAARKLGLEEVPVMTATGWTEAQRRAYVLADNKLAMNAGWDEELLALELGDLAEMGFDLPTVGFSEAELSALLTPKDVAEGEDEAPEAPENAISRPGDLWTLGHHRLLCGDATDAADVARLLEGVSPHLIVTDPPYGVEYDPEWRNATGLSQSERTGKVANDDRADWREAWALFPGDVAYVWCASRFLPEVAESLEACGFERRALIVWAKNRMAIGRGHYHWQHECAWYAVRKGKTGHWQGDRTQTTLWAISHQGQDAETVHGTQKPVECMRRPIVNNSSPGQAVYEPFSGSGTTIIAAETTGRACLAMELEPRYVDVAVQRWEQFTEASAVHAESGQTYAALKEERDGG